MLELRNDYKTKSPTEDDFSKNFYVRDYYKKDFVYLSPEVTEVNTKNNLNDFVAYKSNGEKTLLSKWFQEMLSGLRQFFYQGSLHGVKYIFEPKFNSRERVTWVILVTVSVMMCAGVIAQLFWKTSSNTPFVNVIDSLPTPIWAVPFPSVVLCPLLHIQLSFANVSELEGMQRFFASRVCPKMFGENLYLKERLTVAQNKKLQDFIGSPKCSDIVKACSWRGVNQQTKWMANECCERYFKPIFTNYGLCYSFNGLPLHGMKNNTLPWQKTFNPEADYSTLQWNLDSGYPKVFPPDPSELPYRITASGEANGLGMELYLNKSEFQIPCEGSNVGFNLLIRSPTNHAYTSTVLRIPMSRMTTIEVYPITYKTDLNLKSTLTPERRQCFFQNERHLFYYEFYTDMNCKHDLLVRQVSTICNCVPYNWPRLRIEDPICVTKKDIECIDTVKAKVEEDLMQAYFDEDEGGSHREWLTSCHPSCNDVLYSSQVFYSNFIREQRHDLPIWGDAITGEITRINVHFHDDMFLGQHRHAQYDSYYFIGTIGGLLSLFMGFSIISVAEFVYFVLLRPFNVILKHIWEQILKLIIRCKALNK